MLVRVRVGVRRFSGYDTYMALVNLFVAVFSAEDDFCNNSEMLRGAVNGVTTKSVDIFSIRVLQQLDRQLSFTSTRHVQNGSSSCPQGLHPERRLAMFKARAARAQTSCFKSPTDLHGYFRLGLFSTSPCCFARQVNNDALGASPHDSRDLRPRCGGN